MGKSPIRANMIVRYHPIIGGEHDGKRYRVRELGDLNGKPVAWKELAQAGAMALRALIHLEG